MKRLAIAIVVVAFPVSLLAQQSAKPTQTPAPAKPPAAASSATFPKGDYTATLTDGSVLSVQFGEGVYTAFSDGQQVATGKYSAKGNQIVVSDNSDACGMAGEGTYTWAFDGKALTFKGDKDSCDVRLNILTTNAFVKKSTKG
jgi:hypothetical protein